MRVLVTGASGMLGRAAATRLLDRGDEVTVLQRRPSGLPCREVLGDVADSAVVERAARGQDAVLRPGERYLDHFTNIRKLHKYLKSMALQHGVPVVPSYSLDATLSHVIDLVVSEAFRAVPDPVAT